MKMLAAWAVLVAFLPACLPTPRYVIHYAPGGGVLVGDRVVFLVEQSQLHEDGQLLLVSCLPTTGGAVVRCDRQFVTLGAPASEESVAAEMVRNTVVRTAATVLGCTEIRIQSGNAVEGFWVAGCGVQRFFRREEGVWVDRTP